MKRLFLVLLVTACDNGLTAPKNQYCPVITTSIKTDTTYQGGIFNVMIIRSKPVQTVTWSKC